MSLTPPVPPPRGTPDLLAPPDDTSVTTSRPVSPTMPLADPTASHLPGHGPMHPQMTKRIRR